jgi:ribose 5-phosphate isomerase B
MHILIGADANGFALKEELKIYLLALGHTLTDVGVDEAHDSALYPDIALSLALRIQEGESDRGILICGTGIGMAMTANKVPGVRAACCHDPYSAERARKSNNAQIITFGAQIIAPTLACQLLDHWLAAEFQGGRSLPKVKRMDEIDRHYRHNNPEQDLP